MMTLLKKKLDGGLRKIFFILLFFSLIVSKNLNSSQILDYETEQFINLLINDIKDTNKINRDLNFKIISDSNINAYVDQNNIIYITSGLIENCRDYVALLSVIAHEVGHIDMNHIAVRKNNFSKLKNLNNISSLSIIAGSLISNNPEVLKGILLGSAGASNHYINFSKNQEREADYYSLNTLKNMNIYSTSIIHLLNTIEEDYLEKGISKEMQKKSTHPYFQERIEIIKFLNEKKELKYDNIKNNRFTYIKTKFLGYNNNLLEINQLDSFFQLYAKSIIDAKKGNLKNSMKELNNLISIDKNNIFLLETKADILFSYGYINEAIRFYKKVVNELPDNYYAKIRILENTKIEELSIEESEKIFNQNLNLLSNYYNNKNILLTYLKLSKYTNRNDWNKFLNFWINKKNNKREIKERLIKFKKTKDKELLDLVNLIYNSYK